MSMNEQTASRAAVVIERTFEAPVAVIWQMWTDPEHFAAWYGPDGAVVDVVEMDVHVGGRRHVCMEIATPGGVRRMCFAGEHVDVVENELLVYTEFMSDDDGRPLPVYAGSGHPTTTEVRVELAHAGPATRMVLTHLGIPADSPGAVGWHMALDKLAHHLAVA
jgi:uncharacterized protein YndB with AHSA1/START domain